jgi:hypothetical protein
MNKSVFMISKIDFLSPPQKINPILTHAHNFAFRLVLFGSNNSLYLYSPPKALRHSEICKIFLSQKIRRSGLLILYPRTDQCLKKRFCCLDSIREMLIQEYTSEQDKLK